MNSGLSEFPEIINVGRFQRLLRLWVDVYTDKIRFIELPQISAICRRLMELPHIIVVSAKRRCISWIFLIVAYRGCFLGDERGNVAV